MRLVPIDDVFCAAVPEGRESDPFLDDEFRALALRSVVSQYDGSPPALIDVNVEWLFTSDPAEVDKFQPAHDCERCRTGNDQARAFLRDNPGRTIALGNIHYVEVWK